MSDEDDDQRLFFPGFGPPGEQPEPDADDAETPSGETQGQASQEGSGQLGIPGLSADQEKAVQLALSGLGFVMVAIKPTDGGADFFTAVHGDADQIAAAHPHLDGVIERALRRHGVIE